MTKHIRLALIAIAWLLLRATTETQAQEFPPALTLAGGGALQDTAESGLPANLVVPASHRSVLEEMWEKSPTFRAQCERIARARWVTIRIHLFPSKARLANASTHLVTRPGAVLTADVYIGQHNRIVELVAHEIEHIIERLEDIDLFQIARRATDVVWASAAGEYETRRALRSGLIVASEVINARD